MPTIVHFDISADEPARASAFYEGVFGWKIASPPGMEGYYLIETADLEGKPGVGGGLAKREAPGQGITNFFGVSSLEDHNSMVEKLGGKVLQPKITVPGWGHMSVCLDTEGNTFGLWQDDVAAAV